MASNIIDKFTEMDDLLKINVFISNKLLQQQQLTNKLLYVLLQAYSGKAQDLTQITGSPEFGALSDDYKTFSFVRPNVSGRDVDIFEKVGSGMISQLLFLSSVSDSDNSSYTIKILSDNDVLSDSSYTTLATSSNYFTDITAYNDSTYYICIFKDIAFTDNIKIQVYNSSATFTTVYIKYHLKVD